MKIFYKEDIHPLLVAEEDYTTLNLKDAIQKTRQALDTAYTGFNNALEKDLIDSYIYEINALQKRYEHLTSLAEAESSPAPQRLNTHSPIRTLVSHVFG